MHTARVPNVHALTLEQFASNYSGAATTLFKALLPPLLPSASHAYLDRLVHAVSKYDLSQVEL